MAENRYAEVEIDRIARRLNQPRRHFEPDALDELGETIPPSA